MHLSSTLSLSLSLSLERGHKPVSTGFPTEPFLLCNHAWFVAIPAAHTLPCCAPSRHAAPHAAPPLATPQSEDDKRVDPWFLGTRDRGRRSHNLSVTPNGQPLNVQVTTHDKGRGRLSLETLESFPTWELCALAQTWVGCTGESMRGS